MEAEQRALDWLQAVHPEAHQAARCFETFAQLLRERADEQATCWFAQWMAAAAESQSPERTAFVTKLRQDLNAVSAALQLPCSQGQTEGRSIG
jgi:transposase